MLRNVGLSEDRLYKSAVDCARLNYEGCAGDCTNCQFNVFNYVQDIREASLLKANAYTDFHSRLASQQKYKHERTVQQTSTGAFGLLLIAAVACFINSCIIKPYKARKQINVPYENEYSIKTVLYRVQHTVVGDYNYDTQINCIDYALLFRSLYGPEAQLYYNKKINHMFIKVNNVAIEPQADTPIYEMSRIWGKRYDSKYDTNVTAQFMAYVP